jgi:NTE family protein
MMRNKNQYCFSFLALFFYKSRAHTLLAIFLALTLTSCASKPPQIHIPVVEPTPPPPPKSIEVALILGAGGSRALAHLGVLEVLEEEGIPIDLIVGCSAGSLIGALYADNPNAAAIKNKIINLKRKDLIDPCFSSLLMTPIRVTGPVQGHALESFMVKELKAKNFEDLKIPLIAVATNINNNQVVLLRSGPIAPAVHASSALPPIFSPVNLYNQTLVDGGVISPVPVHVAKGYNPKLTIAVDISTPPAKDPMSNAFDLAYRSLHISFYELSRTQSRTADIFIHPNLTGYGTFDDESNLQLYEKGKATARAAIQDIKKALAAKGIKLRRPTTASNKGNYNN